MATKGGWKNEKTRLENLSLDERRHNYFCGEKYVPLSQLPTWKEYFHENQKSLTEKGKIVDTQLL